jgi:hypothetical protein
VLFVWFSFDGSVFRRLESIEGSLPGTAGRHVSKIISDRSELSRKLPAIEWMLWARPKGKIDGVDGMEKVGLERRCGESDCKLAGKKLGQFL